jgi:hypothetical protein
LFVAPSAGQVGQVSFGVFRIAGFGPLLDHDFHRFAFVLVQQVVDRPDGGRTEPRSAAACHDAPQHDDEDERKDDQTGDAFEGHRCILSGSGALPP